MEIRNIAVKEQIVKTVVPSGNGGAVWVPKNWLGQEVVVILPKKPELEIKEKILHLLEPYLKDIISVGIHGSYARNEQTKDSDVDVLVITKDKNLKLDFKSEKLDVVSLPLDRLEKSIEKYPVMYYQMVQESEPLINSYVLEDLKNVRIDEGSFKDYLRETKEQLKSSIEFVELDKLDGDHLESQSVLYSSVLRLKGLFIIRTILKKAKYSNKNFRKWLICQGLSSKEFEDSYNAYRLIRDDKDTKNLKIKLDVVQKVLNILDRELKLLEAQIYGKQKEKASKRH